MTGVDNAASRPARPSLLYLSVNDGSDTRINKEVATLSAEWVVHFVGVNQDGGPNLVDRWAKRSHRIDGRRHSLMTAVRLMAKVRWIRRTLQPQSVHVINEDLWLLLCLSAGPARRVVLDVFDSFFLRRAVPRSVRVAMERRAYAGLRRIIVTDTARAALMPGYTRPRVVVVENYPYRFRGALKPKKVGPVSVYFCGSLHADRGTGFLRGLLAADPTLRVRMAGWAYDDEARALTQHPQVEWLGTVDQRRSMEIASECTFILSLYAPSNQNNIHASPNKIYDAIQAGTPVIINAEVKVSQFVRDHGLGVILPKYDVQDFAAVARELREFAAGYRPDPALRERYTWESVAPKLLEAHGLGAGVEEGERAVKSEG